MNDLEFAYIFLLVWDKTCTHCYKLNINLLDEGHKSRKIVWYFHFWRNDREYPRILTGNSKRKPLLKLTFSFSFSLIFDNRSIPVVLSCSKLVSCQVFLGQLTLDLLSILLELFFCFIRFLKSFSMIFFIIKSSLMSAVDCDATTSY